MMILQLKRKTGVETLAVHWVSCLPWNGRPKLVAMVKEPVMGFMGLGPIIDLDDDDIESFNVLEEGEDAANPVPVV